MAETEKKTPKDKKERSVNIAVIIIGLIAMVSIVILLFSQEPGKILEAFADYQVFGFILGFSITLFLGAPIYYLMNKEWLSKTKNLIPDSDDKEKFMKVFDIKNDSRTITPIILIGYLERLLLYVFFWSGFYYLIAGWLAFKLGSKWESWKNIINVPDELNKADTAEYMRVRNRVGSLILQRWLVGNLVNILAGFIGFAIGKFAEKLIVS